MAISLSWRRAGQIVVIGVLFTQISAAADPDKPAFTFHAGADEVHLTFSATDLNDHGVATLRDADVVVIDRDIVVRRFQSFARAMILEEESVLRPNYLPFAVGEAARSGLTAFEQSSSAPADTGKTLANGRVLPRLYIPEEGTSLEEVERAMVELAMRQANNNQTHAARLLDISRDALRYKLKKFELVPAGDDEAGDAVPSENTSN